MIDEAHATGVVGATGRGLVEHFGCGHPDIALGTLSKALGAEGGYVCGRRTLIDYLTNRSRSFVFSTAPSAASAAAADAALTVLESEPERVDALRKAVALFVRELGARGIEVRTESAIAPIPIGDERRALAVAAEVEARGFLIPAIRYPTVARGTARLRAAVMCAHSGPVLAAAAAAIAGACAKENGGER